VSKLIWHRREYLDEDGVVHPGDEATLRSSVENQSGDGAHMNGGFFVLEPVVLALIPSDATILGRQPLRTLACDDLLRAHMPPWLSTSAL